MAIQLYPVSLPSTAQSKECLARHIGRIRESWEFASDDVQEPITFATVLTMDTLAPIMMALSKADLASERELASGWSYRRIDLGDPKYVDLIFTAPGDQKEGFVFRMKPSHYVADEIETVSAYLFTDRKFWYPSSMKLVVDTLKNGKSRPAAFEYNPQYASSQEGRPLMTHGPFRPFDPESVLRVLPPLVEASSSFDPKLLAECISSHSKIVYQTPFKEKHDILIATRGIMAQDGNLAGPALDRMVNFVWRAGMAFDLDDRLADIDGLAKLLVDQGNTSKRAEHDFGDDRCGAYVKVDGERTTVYFRHEKDAMAVTRNGGRLVISAADYKTGETFETYVDMVLEGGHVSKVHEAEPLRSHVTSLLRRWVREIEGLGDEMADTPVIAPASPAP